MAIPLIDDRQEHTLAVSLAWRGDAGKSRYAG
jgi:hypothetical protein